jgi:hypothetical protein
MLTLAIPVIHLWLCIVFMWQLTFVFVPLVWVKKNKLGLNCDKYLDINTSWEEKKSIISVMSPFSDIFPRKEEWNAELLVWGDLTRHGIEVCSEKGKIQSIEFRLDSRFNLNEVNTKIARAAKLLDCAIYFPELNRLIEANEFWIKAAFQDIDKSRDEQDSLEIFFD